MLLNLSLLDRVERLGDLTEDINDLHLRLRQLRLRHWLLQELLWQLRLLLLLRLLVIDDRCCLELRNQRLLLLDRHYLRLS